MQPRTARIALAIYLVIIYATLGVIRTVSNALRDQGLMRPAIMITFAITGAVTLFLIFRRPANRRWPVLATLAVALLAYAAIILPMESPEEKIHFIQYGVVGLLADFSAPIVWSWSRKYAFCSAFVLAAGWIDEIIQAILPSRYYDLRDVAFNAAAGMMALTILAVLRRIGEEKPLGVSSQTRPEVAPSFRA